MTKRIAIALACVAMTATAACGGSDQTQATNPTKETPTLDLLSASQACAQVQMVNDELDGPGNWTIPTYGKFAQMTASLPGESVPEISDALGSVSDKAAEIGEMNLDADENVDAVTQAVGEWSMEYEKVADICARTDSPVARIAY